VVDASDRRGPTNARNLGVDLAACEHVLFCDAGRVVGSVRERVLYL
jgi:hypothetical protein